MRYDGNTSRIVATCLAWLITVSFSFGKDADLFTNVYVVPPTFLSSGAGADPFAWQDADLKSDPVLKVQQTAQEVLEIAGIVFGNHCTAVYNPATSQLIVRNTQDQMELVEAYIDSIVSPMAALQLYLTVREIVFEGELRGLKPGGPLENMFKPEEERAAAGKNFDSFREFQGELSRPPGDFKENATIKGVLTDPQFQLLIRSLSQENSVDLISFSSVMCRSNQPALLQNKKSRCGIIPLVGADRLSIELSMFLPPIGEGISRKGKLHPDFHITIWDGQTVMVERAQKKGDKERRILFVTARLMDPAGIPLNGAAEEADLPKIRENDKKPQAGKNSAEKPKTHVVGQGETLYEIALKFGCSVSAIKKLNRSKSDVIELGQLLLVPDWGEGVDRLEKENDSELNLVLKKVIIPNIDFSDVPLRDCLGLFLAELLKQTKVDLFPGITPKISLPNSEKIGNSKITLRLKNVPAQEALRYITALAQCKYGIEGEAIVITTAK